MFQFEVLIGEAFTVDAFTWEERESRFGETGLAQTKQIFGVRIPGTPPILCAKLGSRRVRGHKSCPLHCSGLEAKPNHADRQGGAQGQAELVNSSHSGLLEEYSSMAF